jgi:hypothetical protein
MELQGIHDVFHISPLRIYLTDPDQVVNDANIENDSGFEPRGETNPIYRPRSEENEAKDDPHDENTWNHHPKRDAT